MSDPGKNDGDIDSTEGGTANDSAPDSSEKYLYDVDWKALRNAPAGEASPPIGNAPIAALTDTTAQEADVRKHIAYWLLVIFTATIAVALASAFFAFHWTEGKDILLVLLPAETGLLGSVLGFYFASKAGK